MNLIYSKPEIGWDLDYDTDEQEETEVQKCLKVY